MMLSDVGRSIMAYANGLRHAGVRDPLRFVRLPWFFPISIGALRPIWRDLELEALRAQIFGTCRKMIQSLPS